MNGVKTQLINVAQHCLHGGQVGVQAGEKAIAMGVQGDGVGSCCCLAQGAPACSSRDTRVAEAKKAVVMRIVFLYN